MKSFIEHSDAQEARAAQDRMRADVEISKLHDKAMRLSDARDRSQKDYQQALQAAQDQQMRAPNIHPQ